MAVLLAALRGLKEGCYVYSLPSPPAVILELNYCLSLKCKTKDVLTLQCLDTVGLDTLTKKKKPFISACQTKIKEIREWFSSRSPKNKEQLSNFWEMKPNIIYL